MRVADERSSGPRPPLLPGAACALATEIDAATAVLVEGWSDEAALRALAERRGCDLRARRVCVLPIGGVTNLARFAAVLGPQGLGLRIAGLYDAGEEAYVMRCLQRLQGSPVSDRAAAEGFGFYACDADLEDELLRALGFAAIERILADEAELSSFRRFQVQPAQRGRDVHAQMRRFIGTRAGRKIRYGTLLAQALPPDAVPRPLASVLDRACEDAG